jgi:hypothetical protein
MRSSIRQPTSISSWKGTCPFVQRKQPEVSYFTDLKRVGEIASFSARLTILRESFEVLDTWQLLHDQDELTTLEQPIREADQFGSFARVKSH